MGRGSMWGGGNEKEGGRGKRGRLRTLREDYHIALCLRKSCSSQELKVLFFISVHSGTIIASACLLCLGI